MQDELWYIEECPLEEAKLPPWFPDRIKAPWYQTLLNDIKERGMLSPLLVDNRDRLMPMRIRIGTNRWRVARDLGWKTVRVLGFGTPPKRLPYKLLESLEEAQSYIKDGHLSYDANRGLRVVGAMPPEQEKYPDDPT